MNIIQLGLVRDIEVENGLARVRAVQAAAALVEDGADGVDGDTHLFSDLFECISEMASAVDHLGLMYESDLLCVSL